MGTVEDAPDDRVVIRNGERLNGGMAKIPGEVGEEIPPHWLAYFAVADVEAAVETAKAAGGEAMAGPIEIPVGEFALLADPQGAVFAVFAGDFED